MGSIVPASLVAQTAKTSACNAGDQGLIPGSGRSPGEGNGNPLQYPCLENSMDGGTSLATVHGVAKSRTQQATSLSLSLSPLAQSLSSLSRKGSVLGSPPSMQTAGHPPRDAVCHLRAGYTGVPICENLQ